MSRETWMLMVQVAKQKLAPARTAAGKVLRRRKRVSLPVRSAREDHYALLLAAQY
jgi:hypothetical protein